MQYLKCHLCTTELRFRNEKTLQEHISKVHESKYKYFQARLQNAQLGKTKSFSNTDVTMMEQEKEKNDFEECMDFDFVSC